MVDEKIAENRKALLKKMLEVCMNVLNSGEAKIVGAFTWWVSRALLIS